jgi:hypothetical protein
MKQEAKSAGSISIGVPAVVVGVLIALKHIGMTSLSYWHIAMFGVEVWLVCVAIVFSLWLIVMLLGIIFGSIK